MKLWDKLKNLFRKTPPQTSSPAKKVNAADQKRKEFFSGSLKSLHEEERTLRTEIRKLENSDAQQEKTRLEDKKKQLEDEQKQLKKELKDYEDACAKREELFTKQEVLCKDVENLKTQIADEERRKGKLEKDKESLVAERNRLRKSACVCISAPAGQPFYLKVLVSDCPPTLMRHDIAIPPRQLLPPVDAAGIKWAFDGHRVGKIIQAKSLPPYQSLAIIGDVHGDYDTLRYIVADRLDKSQGCIFLFLGDLIDRGPYSLDCVRLVVWLARKLPGHVLWLKGNHDTLEFNAAADRFTSEANPCEFVDELNAKPALRDEGKRIAKLMADLPLGCLVEDTWISHGGVVQPDELKSMTAPGALSPLAESDLIWTRMVDAKSKMVNRASKGADAGFEQAKLFADKVKEIYGAQITHLVFGHQHREAASPGGEVGWSVDEWKKDTPNPRVGYIKYTNFFGDGKGLTCQLVQSFLKDPLSASPAILEWRKDLGEPVPIFDNHVI